MGEERAVGMSRARVGDPGAEVVDAELEIAQFADAATPGSGGAADGADGATGGFAAELELVAEQRDEYLALAQRTQADFENYRKRVARDAAGAEQRGVGRLARELLPALDNLERALAAPATQAPTSCWSMACGSCSASCARRSSVSASSPSARPASASTPSCTRRSRSCPRRREPGEITEVYQAGYRLAGGRDPAAGARRRRGLGARRWRPARTPTRSSASTRRRPPRRSRRPTASSRASTTPTATPTTRTAEARFKEVGEANEPARDPRSAPPTTAARRALRRRRAAATRSAAAASTARASATSSPTSSGAAAARGRARARDRSAGATSRRRCRSASSRPSHGAQVPLTVPLTERCATCSGTGARPGTRPSVCPRCEGRGIESQGQGMFSITQPCSRCGGSGTVIESPCPTCNGTGATRGVKRLRVNIPAGVHDGSRIRLAGKGETGAARRRAGRPLRDHARHVLAGASRRRARTSRSRCR